MFGNQQASGDSELAGASPLAINVVTDGKGAVRRRPGISAWSGFPGTIPIAHEVTGIHDFQGNVYYVTSGREWYKVVPSTAVATAMHGLTAETFVEGTSRPVFARTPYRLVIATGATPQNTPGSSASSDRLGSLSPAPPPDSTFVAHLASRLFSNDLTSTSTRIWARFSDPGDDGGGTQGEEYWDPLNFATAEADPDAIVALRATNNELWAFGERTLQVFSPDPINVITPGRTVAVGCSAPYSTVRIDDSFAWFDDQRRFVMSDGRGYDEISGPIAATLDSITTVSDCYGFRVNMDQFDLVTWVFPTDGRAFCFQNGGGWAQWHGWTEGVGHTLFAAKSHHYFDTDAVHLVGLSTGQVAKFDTSAYTDLGTRYKAEVLSGFENRGTDDFKHCEALRLTFKRGQSATAPTVMLSWRDDLGAFCTPIRISLGATGDYITVVEKRSLGRYRRRQWKLEMTDAADLALAGAEEVFTGGN